MREGEGPGGLEGAEDGRAVIVEAIRASWSSETSERPDQWNPANPAMGHCDVSSFVAWEHLGGELVLGEVHLGGAFHEHHYWNRIDGVDLDLTASQFINGEVITEKQVLSTDFLSSNWDAIRPGVRARIEAFRTVVERRLSSA